MLTLGVTEGNREGGVGEWGAGGSRRRRSRKRNTDSESDKTGEESSARLIIVWLLGAICVRSGRKSESLFTDFTPQVCATRPVVRARENDGRCPIVCRLLDSERTLGANGSPALPGVVVVVGGGSTLCRRAIKSSSGLVRGVFPLVACAAAVWRGSDGVEDRLGLLFDFVLLFPSEPHLLRQSGSQVQGEGRMGGGGGWLRGESS